MILNMLFLRKSMFSFLTFIFFSLIASIFFPNPVDAHFAGQTSYFKINGEYVVLYPVLLNADPAPGFILPEDNASKNYLINQDLAFELDKNFLPINQLDIQNAQFYWDFGDGTKGVGFVQAHRYSKIGSYILTITISHAPSYVSPFPNYPFESVLVTILPNSNYQLPQARIYVNNKGVHDSLTDYVWVDFSQEMQFDGLRSQAGSSAIVSYLWDFGDQKSATKARIVHAYDKTTGQSYPILRVIDANGFISDTFIELNNSLYAQGKNPLKVQNINQNSVMNSSMKLSLYIKRLTTDAFAQSGKVNYSLILTILIFSFFAGSLHALTPGHGKTLMAAFLIGKGKSKIFDVAILALTMTFTHTIVIYILGVLFLLINIHYSINTLIPYFDKVGAILIIILAGMLIYKGYKNFIHRLHHIHQHEHTHSHDHIHQNNTSKTMLGLFLAGISGGLTPCIDALALLILAVTLHQILFGLFVIFIFSLGLASSIILLGLLFVVGKNKLVISEKIGNLAEIYAPIIAGIFILLLALRLLVG